MGDLVEVGPGFSQLGLGGLQGVTGAGDFGEELPHQLVIDSRAARAGQGNAKQGMEERGRIGTGRALRSAC